MSLGSKEHTSYEGGCIERAIAASAEAAAIDHDGSTNERRRGETMEATRTAEIYYVYRSSDRRQIPGTVRLAMGKYTC